MNRIILEESGYPSEYHELYDAGVLRKTITEAQARWDSTGDIAQTIAVLAARLSKYQPFRETNHRTAHAVARRFLDLNGHGDLMPEDDVDLGDILAKDRDADRTLAQQEEEITRLFRDRQEKSVERLEKGPTTTQTPVPDEDAYPAHPRPSGDSDSEFDRFKNLAEGIVQVSKSEIAEEEEES